jgi:hypothetical protein
MTERTTAIPKVFKFATHKSSKRARVERATKGCYNKKGQETNHRRLEVLKQY